MNGCVYASLADKKIMINHRHVVFRQLNVCPSQFWLSDHANFQAYQTKVKLASIGRRGYGIKMPQRNEPQD